MDRRAFIRNSVGLTAATCIGSCESGPTTSHGEAPDPIAPETPEPAPATPEPRAATPDPEPTPKPSPRALDQDFPEWELGNSSTAPDTVLMFRGNPSHTFYGTGPIRSQPELAWALSLGVHDGVRADGSRFHWAGTGWTGQAVRWGTRIYVGAVDTKFYCVDARSGKIHWTYADANMFKSSCCFYRGRLYIGNVDNFIRCLDARDGSLIWRYDTKRDCDSSPCVVNGWLYIGGEDGKVKCLNPDDGTLRWALELGEGIGAPRGSGGIESSPAVVDGELYVGHYDGYLICVDAETGQRKWKARTGGDTDVSPVVVDDLVYIASESDSPFLRAFDRSKQGEQVWEFESWRGFWSTPALVEGRLYIGGHNGVMYCLDAKTGTELWTFKAEASIWCSPVVVDGKVLFGSHDPYFYMLDAKTGALVWKYEIGGRVHSTPCVVEGTIYVGSTNGTLYCFA